MFLVVGKGVFTKDRLVELLQQWGVVNANTEVNKIEKMGRTEIGNKRIMVMR